jgi:hypothetical protein
LTARSNLKGGGGRGTNLGRPLENDMQKSIFEVPFVKVKLSGMSTLLPENVHEKTKSPLLRAV